jgi:hypothetical protein
MDKLSKFKKYYLPEVIIVFSIMFLILILYESTLLNHAVFIDLIIATFVIGVVMGPITREIIERKKQTGSGANQ